MGLLYQTQKEFLLLDARITHVTRLPSPTMLLAIIPAAWVFIAAGGDPRLEKRRLTPTNQVLQILPQRQGSALVVTAGTAYRLALPRDHTPLRLKPASRYDRMRIASAPKQHALTIDQCVLTPETRGLRSRCLGGERFFTFGGFPVTSIAQFNGRLYVGTYGGGLRTLDAPDQTVQGFPSIIYALRTHGPHLLAGTQEGLFAFDGSKASQVPLT
jgi:hypothetical protein